MSLPWQLNPISFIVFQISSHFKQEFWKIMTANAYLSPTLGQGVLKCLHLLSLLFLSVALWRKCSHLTDGEWKATEFNLTAQVHRECCVRIDIATEIRPWLQGHEHCPLLLQRGIFNNAYDLKELLSPFWRYHVFLLTASALVQLAMTKGPLLTDTLVGTLHTFPSLDTTSARWLRCCYKLLKGLQLYILGTYFTILLLL